MSRVIQLAYDDVRRLDDSSANLRRGDNVLAVFPETTSFYRAVVVKTPKTPSNVASGNWEVVVKFEVSRVFMCDFISVSVRAVE